MQITKKLKILHLEDIVSDALLINAQLKKGKVDCEILVVDTKEKFIKELNKFSPDIILADHSLPSFNSQDALAFLYKAGLKIPFIIVTAAMYDEFAADMIIKGADDYILKDRLHRLPSAIQDAIEKHRLQHENKVVIDALIKSETRLKQTQAIANIGSWELDYATGVAVWSDEQLKIYGFQPENNRQSFETWVSYIHPEDVEYVLQKTNDAKSTLSNADYFHRIIRRDGTVRHLYSQIRVRGDNSGNPTGLYGVTRDVTEAKKRENTLRDSQLNLQAIFENTSDGFILADINGIIKSFNSKARDRTLLNIGREISVGKSISDFLPYSGKKINKDNISKVLAGEIVRYDYAYTRKNGDTKWFSFTINPVYNAEKIDGISLTSTDITERKKAEEQLKESELFNKGILASLSSQIAVIDYKGNIVAVNKAWDDFAKTNGVLILETVSIGSNYIDVCQKSKASGDNVAAQTLKGIQSVFNKDVKTFELEYPCHSPTEQRWFNLSVINFGKDDSKVVLSHQNITQQKLAEEERNSLQATLQNSLNEIYIFDFETFEFIYVNKGALLNLGYSEDEIKTLTPLDLKPDFTATSFKQLIVPLVNNEKEKIIFFTNHKRKDGSLYPVEIHLQLVTEGNSKRFLAIVLDITERKISDEKVIKLNEAIAKSEKFFKGVIESSDDMITVIDPAGKTIYASPAVSKKFGYSHEECLNINLADILHPDDVLIMQEFLVKIMMHPGVPMECPLIRERKKDGTYMWVEGTLTNFLETGGINAIVANFRDVTERKKSADERENITADLIHRNKDLEQFSYIVSHNMRAPVADIIGLCDVLQKDHLTDVFKSKIVSGLSSSVNMLDDVFKDLNNILKVREGVNENKQKVSFTKLIDNITLSIGSVIEKEKAIILLDFSAVDEIVTIKTYLHSIFYNLITNSLKYRQAGISPVIKISSQQSNGKIVLFFNDNGIGIDLKKSGNNVFGLYKRFHTTVAEGKGMGLYMVKTQVESIGGKISITSAVNKGTAFKIEFAT